MIVAFGLDGTVCDSRWRKPLIEEEGWDAYHSALVHDAPHLPACNLIRGLACCGSLRLVAVTGRPEKWRHRTNEWLMKHDVAAHDLMMRGGGDYRQSPLVKIDLMTGLLHGDLTDLMMIDDRDDVIAAFRERGVACLQLMAAR